jgi:hypothetical protein
VIHAVLITKSWGGTLLMTRSERYQTAFFVKHYGTGVIMDSPETDRPLSLAYRVAAGVVAVLEIGAIIGTIPIFGGRQ